MWAYALLVWLASNVVPEPPTRLVHPLNISEELVTLFVVHPVPAYIVVRLLQLENMSSILVTLRVSNFVRSRLFKLLQP